MNREMKDSGVEWIGEIPEDWNIQRGKFIFTKLSRSVQDNDEVITCFRDGEVTLRKNRREEGFTFSDKEIGYQGIEPGDLVVHGMDGFAGSIGISDSRGKATPVLNVLDTKYSKLYYMYYLRSMAYGDVFTAIATGIRVRSCNLNWNKLGELSYPVPSANEQKNIANYIKTKCTAIDTAIEKTKKSIEKLEEYKKAVITKAVTKGIDPNARMKDAHFLWLTAIPENWGIYKLNHILDYNHPYPLGDGDHGSIKADSYVSSGIPFIRVQNLGYAEPINIANVVYITEAQNQKIQNSTLAPNDILFAKTGATIGKTAIMPQTISRANTTSHIGKITVDTRYYVPKYIFYALSSEIGNHQLWSIANKKATRPEVGLDEVKYIKLCIPLSLTEQKQIADFLDEKLNQINNVISNHANLIRKLEEYKKSLIYYAVTGKIDCRNEVI